MIKKWETISSSFAGNFKIFDISRIKRRHPDLDKQGDFVVLNSAEWVNIIPVTKDNKVVFVEQYRHGTDEITLEVPGGLVELNEDPRLAAERECAEETGFVGTNNAVLLGENTPNPAFLNNKCYSWVWFGCEKKVAQSFDTHEDIGVVELSFEEVREYILSGKIKHSLVLTAFFFYFLKYGDLKRPE